MVGAHLAVKPWLNPYSRGLKLLLTVGVDLIVYPLRNNLAIVSALHVFFFKVLPLLVISCETNLEFSLSKLEAIEIS